MSVREYIIANPPKPGERPHDYFQRVAAALGCNPQSVEKPFYQERKRGFQQTEEEPEVIKEHTTWDEQEDNAKFQYEGFRNFATLEEALEFCNADLDTWEVDRWTFNAWDVTMKDKSKNPVKRTNYQVKIWFKRRVEEMAVEEWTKELARRSNVFIVQRNPGSGIGVFKMSDFHMGAYIGHLLKTPDYNFNTIEHYLTQVVDYINAKGYNAVYLSLLGDFIESFTGLNHKDSWKGLAKNAYGIKVVKLAHNMLRDHLYTKINNLEWVGFVSGNHDRVTEKTEGDAMGGAAEALHWAFTLDCDIDSEWHPILISKVVDGICYIDTHGHLGLTKSDIAQIVFKYGRQDMYNIFCKGHKHTREQKRRWLKTLFKINNQDVVSYDEADFRAVTVPPLFTGNFYSQSNDWNGLAGFVEFYNNGRGHPIFIDYTL